jgi:hypothetical protein
MKTKRNIGVCSSMSAQRSSKAGAKAAYQYESEKPANQ